MHLSGSIYAPVWPCQYAPVWYYALPQKNIWNFVKVITYFPDTWLCTSLKLCTSGLILHTSPANYVLLQQGSAKITNYADKSDWFVLLMWWEESNWIRIFHNWVTQFSQLLKMMKKFHIFDSNSSDIPYIWIYHTWKDMYRWDDCIWMRVIENWNENM